MLHTSAPPALPRTTTTTTPPPSTTNTTLPAVAANTTTTKATTTPPTTSTQDELWHQVWTELFTTVLRKHATHKLNKTQRRGLILPRTYEKTVRKLEDSVWISALQLTQWDNIFGPRIENLWNGIEQLEDEVQLKTARHSLSGELGDEEKLDSNIESKFHVFSEFGYIMATQLFTAPFRGAITKFSFCLIIRNHFMARYLLLHPTIKNHMYLLVLKLRIFLMKVRYPLVINRCYVHVMIVESGKMPLR
eukprot:TRINITY_DN2584_c0_g1_i3.p2 TRINITY_DN2584_c0_g1~~TRINITY_DN2584_c0_g1_i3.p2  ORF type:complete len:248 (+),score=46.40 TRINITY_DN2584_c0_g1_i3:59-802(+)